MKTNNNTLDLRIAQAMREAANVVFEAMPKTQDVNITSMQVYQHFNDARINIPGMPKDSEFLANIPASEGDGWSINEDHVITISVDTFSCKCEGVMIFNHLHTFERIASAKDKARFVYAMPKSNSAHTFTVNVEKSAIDILKNADNNELRRVMCGVYIDLRRANLVASDGHTLQIMKCALSGDVPSVDGVVIPANIAKRVLKDREFTITIDGTHIICGNECFNELGRYPAYLSVWNKYESAEDESINLAPKAWKEIQSQAKRAIKSSNNAVFVFHALSGEGVITIDVWDKYERAKLNEFKVFTKNTVPVSFAFAWNATTVMRFKDVESIQGLNADRGVTLFSANYIGFAMPVCMDFCDANYLVLPYEDKKRNYDPVSAYREMINTVPVETMEETANTIPVEMMEETANTIPVETMEETANTIPVETTEETANTIPVETMEETANTIPVETMEEDRPENAFIAFIWSMVAACIMAVLVLTGTRPHIALQAANTIPVETMEETANTIPVETMEEAAEAVTIEAAINDVICTGSIDPYIEHVKEEITAYYRESRESQLQELADLASVDDSEVIAAIADPETDPETAESVPTVETIQDTENTPESVEIMPTDTDTESDTGTVSDTDTIDYNSSEYVELSVITTDANGDPVINVYSVPLNE